MRWLELKIPPAALFLIVAGLMWGLSKFFSRFTLTVSGNKWIGVGLFVIGVIIGLVAVASFWKAKTTVNPHHPESTSKFITTGIYRISRNPMYFGLLLGLIGWTVYLVNALNILPLIGFVLYMNRFQIIPEERAMATNFGDEYDQYRKNVRRWI